LIKSFGAGQKVINRATAEIGRVISNRKVNGFYVVETKKPGITTQRSVSEETLENFESGHDLTNIYRRYCYVRLEALYGARELLNYASSIEAAKELLDEAINKLAPKATPSGETGDDTVQGEYCG
jgi:hypothetical protein